MHISRCHTYSRILPRVAYILHMPLNKYLLILLFCDEHDLKYEDDEQKTKAGFIIQSRRTFYFEIF